MVITSEKLKTYFNSNAQIGKLNEDDKIKLSELLKVTKKDYPLDRNTRIKRKNSCYFCGFDIVVHKHHIIERNMGGRYIEDNLICLCPNHHWMIHQGGWKLIYREGYYFLYDGIKWKNMLFPHKLQYGFKREDPKILFKRALRVMKKAGALTIDRG